VIENKPFMRFNVLVFSFLTVVLAVFSLGSCKKNKTKIPSYFYTTTDTSTVRLYLYVGGQYTDQQLPYLTKEKAANFDTIKAKALMLSLNDGTYDLVARDNMGNDKVKGSFKLKNNDLASTEFGEGMSASMIENSLVVEIND
jgi:hypothetical protein